MTKTRTGARPLAELVTQLITPACRKRGIANVALTLEPADLFGERFGRSARVERILWPRGAKFCDGAARDATLVVQADAATALVLQHAAREVIERANIILGWPAISRLKVVQSGVSIERGALTNAAPCRKPPPVHPAPVAAPLADIAHQDLKGALARLGAAVASRGLSRGPKAP